MSNKDENIDDYDNNKKNIIEAVSAILKIIDCGVRWPWMTRND